MLVLVMWPHRPSSALLATWLAAKCLAQAVADAVASVDTISPLAAALRRCDQSSNS